MKRYKVYACLDYDKYYVFDSEFKEEALDRARLKFMKSVETMAFIGVLDEWDLRDPEAPEVTC